MRAGTKKQKYDRIMEKKMITSTESLCRGFPTEFHTYLNYVRSLRFDDKPDYAYLRKLFRDYFIREGYTYDYVFDWTILRRNQLAAQGQGSGAGQAGQESGQNTPGQAGGNPGGPGQSGNAADEQKIKDENVNKWVSEAGAAGALGLSNDQMDDQQQQQQQQQAQQYPSGEASNLRRSSRNHDSGKFHDEVNVIF